MQEEVDHVNTCRAIGIDPLPITWADDVALLLLSSTNERLQPMAQRVVEKLSAAFQRRGFQLNLTRGKTGAVLSYKGADAAEHRRQLLLQDEPGCTIRQGSTMAKLHFSSDYSHLGSCFGMEGNLSGEIQRRIGIGLSAFHQLRHNVFCNRHLHLDIRLQLYESLIASKIWFGSGSWGAVTPKLLRQLDTATMRMIRSIVGAAKGPETQTSDDELRSLYAIPSARARLCRVFFWFVQHANN